MHFRDLNEAVRAGMVEEIRFDIARAALHEGERLGPKSVKSARVWSSLRKATFDRVRVR
jgi:hypothetical protein